MMNLLSSTFLKPTLTMRTLMFPITQLVMKLMSVMSLVLKFLNLWQFLMLVLKLPNLWQFLTVLDIILIGRNYIKRA